MIYLLDTHTFIWNVLETDKLSQNARDIIFCRDNEIFVSTVSFWEISLKAGIKKFSFKGININDFPRYAKNMEFSIMGMGEKESITFHELPVKDNHKDPFDRMLIWQAITGVLTMVSKDRLFEQYKKDGLRLVW